MWINLGTIPIRGIHKVAQATVVNPALEVAGEVAAKEILAAGDRILAVDVWQENLMKIATIVEGITPDCSQ